MPRIRPPFLVILAAISAIVALWESSPALLKTPPVATPKDFPIAYASDTNTRQFDENGQVKYQLQAQHIDYFQPNNNPTAEYALLQAPHITLHNDQGPPWHIRSRHGRIENSGDTLTFTEQVQVWQLNELQQRTELTTEKLVVMLEREYAETDKAVKISAPEGVTHAVGMKVFFDQERLQLLSKVRSTYENF